MKKTYCKQLVIGLPSSGKTTFIAALWHTVTNDEVPGALKLEKLHGDSKHLNAIKSAWIKCCPVDRTISSDEIVSMRLTHPDNNESVELHLPDISGESFNSQWKDRKWKQSYDDLVKESKGALLFIHPHKTESMERIDHADALLSELGEEFNNSEDQTEQERTTSHNIPEKKTEDFSSNWNPDKASTQVKLVELLQFAALRLNSDSEFRIAVIISAWDILLDKRVSPEKWLNSRVPLLSQYLKANSEQFPFKVYGISAQGAEYSDEKNIDLHFSLNQSERILVVEDGAESNDITKPVKWVMG